MRIRQKKSELLSSETSFRSIRWKLTMVMTVMLVSVVSLLTWMHISTQTEMMISELRKRSVIMKEYMIERGRGFTANLAIQVEKDIAVYNFSGVSESVKENVKKHKDIKYAVLISASGTVFEHTLYPEYIRTTLTDQRNLKALNQNAIAIFEYPETDGPVTEIISPIRISTEPWGALRIVYTQHYLNSEINRSEEQISETIRSMMIQSLLTSSALIAVCFLAVNLYSRRFTNPLIQLTDSARRIAQGDFSHSDAIVIRAKDEVGMLAGAFREMSLKLQASYQKLAGYSRTLEQKVAARTGELKQKNTTLSLVNERLEQTLKKLQESQAQLIQSEKMAALGQLIAGIAHEINNPLGVVRGAAQNIFLALDSSFPELPRIFQNLPEELHNSLFELFNRIISRDKKLSTRENRKMRRILTKQLINAEIGNAEILAEMMTDMGLTEADDEVMPLLKWPGAPDIVRTLYSIYGLREDGRNILTAVERASKIVFALKKFSHQDPSGKKILTDIPDCIETVLTLYHNQIRQGVEVVRHYDDIPQFLCFRDELNQVWINLIHNALQAMVYKGRLEIMVSGDEQQLIVSFRDNGNGIPPEISERIFEPFFTTKDMGEGSGLGLVICKKIIQKHKGTIHFESQPGATTFTVWLPVTDENKEDYVSENVWEK